jgi:putative ABC transport system permease protein
MAAPGVVINETAANRFWPDQNPLGKRFTYKENIPQWFTVVGVVGDVRQWSPGSTPRAEVYGTYGLRPRERMFISLNTRGEPRDLIRPARAAVLSLDPLQPVSEIQTMGDILASDFSGREFYTLLIGLFSGLAIFLAAAGIYGVISYFVVQRTHEMGIRLALGANRSGLVALILRRAVKIVVAGLILGLAGAWVATQIIESLLFGVSPLDPRTLGAGVTLLLVTGLAGALLPSLRGTRLSPVAALRSE